MFTFVSHGGLGDVLLMSKSFPVEDTNYNSQSSDPNTLKEGVRKVQKGLVIPYFGRPSRVSTCISKLTPINNSSVFSYFLSL